MISSSSSLGGGTKHMFMLGRSLKNNFNVFYAIPKNKNFFSNLNNSNHFNIGWSKINYNIANNLPTDIKTNDIFYFCHSYYLNFQNNEDKKNCVGYLNNDIFIPSILIKNNFIGVQFHPEKSQKNGENIIKYFLNL